MSAQRTSDRQKSKHTYGQEAKRRRLVVRRWLALFRRGISALVISLLLPLFWAGQPASALQGNQGLQGGWAVDNSGNVIFDKSVVANLPLTQEAGAGWVRVNFRLGDYFSNWTSPGDNGKTALQTYDEVVAAAQQNGLKVLGLLSNESWHGEQMQWVANNAENTPGNGDNTYLRAFSLNAAVPIVRHFAGRVAAWEVWNEPNAWSSTDGAGHYWGGSFIYPSNFAWLLRRVYEDTRQAGINSVQFISGGLLGHDIGGVTATVYTPEGPRTIIKQGSFQAPRPVPPAGQGERAGPDATTTVAFGESGAQYLRATYRYGRTLAGWLQIKRRYGSYPLDSIGQHLYIDQGGATSASEIGTYLQEVRDAYVAYEGRKTAKKTHITEFGWQTSAVSEDTQASNLQIAYDLFHQTAYVARAYWSSIQDIPEASLFFGLIRADRSLKPAFSAYQKAATY